MSAVPLPPTRGDGQVLAQLGQARQLAHLILLAQLRQDGLQEQGEHREKEAVGQKSMMQCSKQATHYRAAAPGWPSAA